MPHYLVWKAPASGQNIHLQQSPHRRWQQLQHLPVHQPDDVVTDFHFKTTTPEPIPIPVPELDFQWSRHAVSRL
jgi:hypothetical protein